MKNTAKHIIISTYLFLFVSLPITAQVIWGESRGGASQRSGGIGEPPGDVGEDPDPASIDSLLIILLLAGITLGYWYFMRTRKTA